MFNVKKWKVSTAVFLVFAVAAAGLALSSMLFPTALFSDRTPAVNQVLSYPTDDLSLASSGLAHINEPITPVTRPVGLDPRKVALGDRLFHDPQLSRNNTISCASCHKRSFGGADGEPRSIGFEGQLVSLNSPTVWNSSFNFRQFWDGRAATLEAQVNGPILDPKEMNSSWSEIIDKLSRDRTYVQAFRALYPTGIKPEAVRESIATYERTLVTPNARFDRYLEGNASSLTTTEKEGYQLFKDYGCVACHQGVNIGGNLYQRLGIMEDFFLTREAVKTADLGRMNISGRSRDRYVFKVPSLRNIALTAPYLHDGSVDTLEETINIMARYQLGREIPPDEVTLIVEFLQTLTGEMPAATQ